MLRKKSKDFSISPTIILLISEVISFFLLFSTIILVCSVASHAATPAIPVYDYQIVHSYPHDTKAFTEGLFYRNGYFYESTGLNGHSSIRKVDIETGQTLQKIDIGKSYFGEGISDWKDKIIGLTWQSQLGFVWNIKNLRQVRSFHYEGEGWGLTHNDQYLIMSDGTPVLRFLDPESLTTLRMITVTAHGEELPELNELEWVDGEIFANVWQTNKIVRIDPESGKVTGIIDLTGLLDQAGPLPSPIDVLNGIAWDKDNHRLFVTGKLWPKIFEITLIPHVSRHK
ncbi:MAG: glutaminyl-peptide cyclotransferase [Zymomonas mobilis]|uniref:Glutamine cyclotransferase n=1 Tax=Zymomonas mobilis TaxID=542 RepID=A0A542VYU3_ZYMMB|nr:glutaminyl-peptide cyclotransferase [Zymomonas mobilis]TQL16491.1 glutamine cyclotransferase [Zymomonas mobilis]